MNRPVLLVGAGAVLGVSLLRCTPETPPAAAPTVVVPSAVAAVPASTSRPAPGDADDASAGVASAPRPSASASPAECKDALPPADMLDDNVATTAVSGLAEILASKKTALDGTSPAPTSDYVSFRYTVRVLRWFSGSGPEQLLLTQGAEAGFDPQAPGRLLFFSGCVSPRGSVWSPDVGYFFPLDPACRPEAERLGDAAAKHAGPADQRKASACERPDD